MYEKNTQGSGLIKIKKRRKIIIGMLEGITHNTHYNKLQNIHY